MMASCSLNKRLKHTTVGVKTCGIQNGIFRSEKLRDAVFQFLVNVLRAADKTHAAHAIAVRV